ncbi:MAG: 6-hydroxycyclohex-1-ene-1-carbonyl-CoA dehydrogenase, partial [Candidatus Neomarinimicrobiota bacterium]
MTALDRPFEETIKPLPTVEEGQALIKVAGCGVCHTDLSFWHYGVPTRKQPPLTLGHEISGIVLEGPAELVNRPVIVPAVLPCGECDLCRQGRSNICRAQQMPGNDFDGGFATHVLVPARFLAQVPPELLKSHELAELAVIADAVSTPYQVIQRSGLEEGDLAVLIGVGGVGIYAAQLARARGAKVLAIDIDQDKLDRLAVVGIADTLSSRDLGIKEIKGRVKELARELDAPPHGWKIFELSGAKAGQELAFALLGIAGTLSIVGFTMDRLEVRLSNLMAFDARVIGTWGCRPELYPEVIKMVADGDVILEPFTELQPLSSINDIFARTLAGELTKRPV